MTDMPEKNLGEARIVVNYDDVPSKPPPSLSVGPIGWIRENLLGSAFDAILTVVSAIVLIVAIVSFLGWGISEANWLVVNQNFRNFMAGTYPLEATWRLNFIYYLSALLVGFTIATYSRVGRGTLIAIGVLLAILFVVPAIAKTTLPPPNAYISAGDVAVESGTITETPGKERAFTITAGTQIRIQLTDSLESDASILEFSGFMDRATAAVVNATNNQLEDIALREELKRTLEANGRLNSEYLTRSQRLALESELADLESETFESLIERYAVNTSPTTIRLLDGASGEILIEEELTPGGDAATFTAPTSGWYILQTEVADADVLSLLEATNIYPLITRGLSIDLVDENGEPIQDEETGRIQTEGIEEFINVYSRDVTRLPRPTLDDEEVDLVRLTDNQYRGERPFVDYITLNLSPFFDLLSMSTLFFSIAGIVGYGASIGIKRLTPDAPGGGVTSLISMGGWALFVFLLFLLTIGMESLNPIGLANLVSTLVWIGVMFFIGTNASTMPSLARPLMSLGFVVLLGHLVFGRILYETRPIPDFLISTGFITELILWMIVGMSAYRNGVQNEDKFEQATMRRGLIGAAALWVGLLILLPILLNAMSAAGIMTNYRMENLLPIARFNLWGGFFLTFMLTAVGIVCSFPIGVLLALGRRAHGYPVIKYFCILFIEFVRGVPLVTVLFMATLLVPLLNPQLATVPQVIRAMIGITMFSAAYLAENVRGGLQSIPSGQEEAGKAVGLSGMQVTMLITLPQALRAVIPALVGQAISLFKDTSLVFIVGLADLTGVATRAVAQSEFVGLRLESYVFISVIYFIFSYVMSYVSRRIEESGSGSARR